MVERSRVAVGLSGLALLAGCSFAPAYHPPSAPAPVAFKEAGPWIPARPADTAPRGDWWTLFGDTTLNGLETRIDKDNPTLAGALGRYDEARGYLHEARAGLFPQIN